MLVDEDLDLESKEKLKNILKHKLKLLMAKKLSDLFNLSQSKFENNTLEPYAINYLKTMV